MMGRNNRQRMKSRVVANVHGGSSLQVAAQDVGVHPSTVARWRKSDRGFDQQLARALQSRAGDASQRIAMSDVLAPGDKHGAGNGLSDDLSQAHADGLGTIDPRGEWDEWDLLEAKIDWESVWQDEDIDERYLRDNQDAIHNLRGSARKYDERAEQLGHIDGFESEDDRQNAQYTMKLMSFEFESIAVAIAGSTDFDESVTDYYITERADFWREYAGRAAANPKPPVGFGQEMASAAKELAHEYERVLSGDHPGLPILSD